MPLKVVGNGPTTSLTLARAVGYAIMNGAKVINDSLNIDPFVNDPVFKAAVQFAYDRGVLWVNSAGNLGIANPARQTLDAMLVVAATDRSDVKSLYSNYGTGIDLAAPGGTPGDGLMTTVNGGVYGTAYGTSMSAALVSGTAALIWSAFPGYTRDQVASAIMGNADGIDAQNPDFVNLLGAGRLDAAKSVSGQPFATKLGPVLGLPAQGQPAPPSLDSFTLRLPSNLDPSTVIPSNFELRWAGPDNQFGTGDDTLIPFTINDGQPYEYGTNQLLFKVNAELAPGLYKFTAKSGGLTDPFGRPVDGDGDGQPGGDLVRIFGVSHQVQGRVFEDVSNSGFSSPTDPGVPGQTVFADLNGNGVFDRSSFTSSQPLMPVPDADPNGVIDAVQVSGLTDPVCELSVSVLITHPYLSDLTITLVGPNGERVLLFRNRQLPGQSTSTPTVLNFQDDIDESSSATPTLVTYNLRPEERLDSLRGITANGTWHVVVADTIPGDTGTLFASTVTIATEPCATTDANGFFTLVGLPVGVSSPLLVATQAGWVRSASGGAIMVEPDGQSNVGIGLVRQGAAYGRVLLDNGDGVFGPNDVGQAGITVYVDRNGNGTPDPGEPTAVTDANGIFVFPGLGAGSFSIRLADVPGYTLISPNSRLAIISGTNPSSFGNDFLIRRATGPVAVAVAPVGGNGPTFPVTSVPISLSEPIPTFGLNNLVLRRDGQGVALTNATLIGAGLKYTLIGLPGLTSQDGQYQLTVNAPAPTGHPERQPAPVNVNWTTDSSDPQVMLTPIRTVGVTAVSVQFSLPVTGVTTASFVLTRDGVPLSLTGAVVVGSGMNYQLSNIAPLTRAVGTYVLQFVTGGAQDASGNPIAGTTTSWQVTTALPPPSTPPAGQRTAVGSGPGQGPLVNVYDSATGKLLFTIVAFEPSFTGGVRVAAGDVNGDGVEDIIVAPGPGGGPRVRVFDGRDGSLIDDLMAFEPTFTGGLYVAAGDITGDGIADLVVTPDQGGGPRVRVFDGKTLNPIADFFGIADPNFRGGARTAVGDVNGDGTPDLVVSAGFGGGPRVAIFDGKSIAPNTIPTRLCNDFFAFEESLRNGAFVAAGDVDGDGSADLVLGGGPGGGPRVLVLSGKDLVNSNQLTTLADFFAGDPNSRGGVRVATKDVNGDGKADVIAGDGDGQRSTVATYDGATLIGQAYVASTEFDAFGNATGGVYVG
jgi:subtilisin-like proprotein convertase family protein